MTRLRVGCAVSGLAAQGFLGTAALHATGTSIAHLAEESGGTLRQLATAHWLVVVVRTHRDRSHRRRGSADASVPWILVVASGRPFSAVGLQLRYLGLVPPTAILISVGLLTLAVRRSFRLHPAWRDATIGGCDV